MRSDDENSRVDRPITAVVAALCLTWAVQKRSGFYLPAALRLLEIAVCASAWAVVGTRLDRLYVRFAPRRLYARLLANSPDIFLGVALVGLVCEVYALLTASPGFAPVNRYPPLGLFHLGVAVGGGLAVLALRDRPLLGRLHMPVVIAVHVLLAIWIIRAIPEPSIDVWYFHKEASAALLDGHSPYSTTIPNIYGEQAAGFYGRGMVTGDRILAGFPYPPLSLLLTLPGYALGDYRYALVAALAGAAALLAALAGRQGRAAAVLLLFMPRVFFIYENGWTEPFVVLMAAVTAYCAVRRPKALPFALAGLLAVKQYLWIAVPLLPLLPLQGRPRDGTRQGPRRVLLLAVGLASAVTLPFLIWDPKGFVDSVILLQTRQPYRPDSLSLLRDISRSLHVAPTSALSLAAAVLGLGLSLRLAPRTAYGFLASLGLVLLALFGFGKQAFANYYFGVVGILLSAAAAARTARSDRPENQACRIETGPAPRQGSRFIFRSRTG